MPPLLKLHVGCGHTRMEGYVNGDLYAGPTVDIVFDLGASWPFVNESVELVYASHVLEHLPDPWTFFREAWRVLIDGGELLLRVPYGGHPSAWGDPTHLRPWYAESFCAFQPGYSATTRNPQHDALGIAFVADIGLRLSESVTRKVRWLPWKRRILDWVHWLCPQVCEEVYASLLALKSAASHARMTHVPNFVPVSYLGATRQSDGTWLLRRIA